MASLKEHLEGCLLAWQAARPALLAMVDSEADLKVLPRACQTALLKEPLEGCLWGWSVALRPRENPTVASRMEKVTVCLKRVAFVQRAMLKVNPLDCPWAW